MLLKVKVIPEAKKNEVIKRGDGLVVKVLAKPEKGRANEMVIKVLAEHFGIKKNQLKIIRGIHSRHKFIEIPE